MLMSTYSSNEYNYITTPLTTTTHYPSDNQILTDNLTLIFKVLKKLGANPKDKYQNHTACYRAVNFNLPCRAIACFCETFCNKQEKKEVKQKRKELQQQRLQKRRL